MIRWRTGLLVPLAGPPALPAQGLPFHTPSALTTAFEERGLRALSTVQRWGDLTTAVSSLIILPFAPHQRITTMVRFPLVYKHRRSSADARSRLGVGDAAASVKWAFLVRNQPRGTSRLAAIAALSLPTGSTNGTVASRALDLGTGAASIGATLVGTHVQGPWGLNASVGHRWHASGQGRRLGRGVSYDVAVGYRIPNRVIDLHTRTLQLYVEWNGSVVGRGRERGVEVGNSGGHLAFVSPGVQWVVLPQFLVEGSVQLPVIQRLNGSQPAYGIRPALGARLLFF